MQFDRVQAISFSTQDITYYFGYGELADYFMAPEPRPESNASLKEHILSNLERLEQLKNQYCEPLLNLFAAVHTLTEGDLLELDDFALDLLKKEDGITILMNVVSRMTDGSRNAKDRKESLQVQMSMKIAMNILYLLLFKMDQKELAATIAQVDIEGMLMKMIQSSLEISFIPIRKVVIMFHLMLRNRFDSGPPITVKEVDDLKNNIILASMLQAETVGTPRILIEDPNPVEAFYKRHNINDCSLAQYIVVGLLRALLTVCSPSKPSSNSPSGVDAYRQWKASFLYASQVHGSSEYFPEKLKSLLELFIIFESNNNRKDERTELTNDLDRHRIYTVAAITSVFSFLLIHFKRNAFLQYSYLIQLMSDANGILVLLKFLTDKFQMVGVQSLSLYSSEEPFLNRTKCTVHNVLLLLLAACNNFTQKIKTFLFDYNSFLILKKLPGLLEDDPTITELSCSLLKLQIPFFTKKMKESSNNMKMITEIYCKCPRVPDPPKAITPYQRLLLKNKIKPKKAKQVLVLQQVKNLHNEFNNYNYWHVQQPKPVPACQYLQKLLKEVQLQPDFAQQYEQWLQQNVWQYYD